MFFSKYNWTDSAVLLIWFSALTKEVVSGKALKKWLPPYAKKLIKFLEYLEYTSDFLICSLKKLDHCHHIIVNISLFSKSFFVYENVMYFLNMSISISSHYHTYWNGKTSIWISTLPKIFNQKSISVFISIKSLATDTSTTVFQLMFLQLLVL